MDTDMTKDTKEFNEFCRFSEKYKQQIEKIQRKMDYYLFKDRNFIKEDIFLEEMFFESILVDVRALLIENAKYKKNYTIQNSFKIHSVSEADLFYKIATGIDDYLKKTLLPDGETSIFEAVKFYTDKYIAHRDNIDEHDDEKKGRIKQYLSRNDENGLVFTIKAIIEYAKDVKSDIQAAALAELTRIPEGLELETVYDTEKRNPNEKDINIKLKLIDEILKKSPKDIAYLAQLDIRGIRIYDMKSMEIQKVVANFVEGVSNSDLLELIIKVKETPNAT